jgi:hypothetical protein
MDFETGTHAVTRASANGKVARILLLVVALSGCVLALITWTVFGRRPLIASLRSPDDQLVLRLKGDPTRPNQPIFDSTVYFDLFRGEQPVLLDKYLHSGDFFDPCFNDLYPQHRWISNSAIRFMREDIAGEKFDTLVLRNETDQTIRYLEIESRDKFLVFDLPARSQVRLSAAPQSASRADLSWLNVEGEFADGRAISWMGTNFMIDGHQGPFEYGITISPNGAQILSSQLAEYRSGNSHE